MAASPPLASTSTASAPASASTPSTALSHPILQPQAQTPRAASPALADALTTREKLLFAQAVHRLGAGDRHWKEVDALLSRCPLVEGEEKREPGYWNVKTCRTIYRELLMTAGLPSPERLTGAEVPGAPPHLKLAQYFYHLRMLELKGEIESHEEQFRTLIDEIDAIKSASYLSPGLGSGASSSTRTTAARVVLCAIRELWNAAHPERRLDEGWVPSGEMVHGLGQGTGEGGGGEVEAGREEGGAVPEGVVGTDKSAQPAAGASEDADVDMASGPGKVGKELPGTTAEDLADLEAVAEEEDNAAQEGVLAAAATAFETKASVERQGSSAREASPAPEPGPTGRTPRTPAPRATRRGKTPQAQTQPQPLAQADTQVSTPTSGPAQPVSAAASAGTAPFLGVEVPPLQPQAQTPAQNRARWTPKPSLPLQTQPLQVQAQEGRAGRGRGDDSYETSGGAGGSRATAAAGPSKAGARGRSPEEGARSSGKAGAGHKGLAAFDTDVRPGLKTRTSGSAESRAAAASAVAARRGSRTARDTPATPASKPSGSAGGRATRHVKEEREVVDSELDTEEAAVDALAVESVPPTPSEAGAEDPTDTLESRHTNKRGVEAEVDDDDEHDVLRLGDSKAPAPPRRRSHRDRDGAPPGKKREASRDQDESAARPTRPGQVESAEVRTTSRTQHAAAPGTRTQRSGKTVARVDSDSDDDLTPPPASPPAEKVDPPRMSPATPPSRPLHGSDKTAGRGRQTKRQASEEEAPVKGGKNNRGSRVPSQGSRDPRRTKRGREDTVPEEDEPADDRKEPRRSRRGAPTDASDPIHEGSSLAGDVDMEDSPPSKRETRRTGRPKRELSPQETGDEDNDENQESSPPKKKSRPNTRTEEAVKREEGRKGRNRGRQQSSKAKENQESEQPEGDDQDEPEARRNRRNRATSTQDPDSDRFAPPRMTRSARHASPAVANKITLNVMNQLHKTILDHRFGPIFAHPIRPKDAPGYYEVIETPMDLETMKRQINDGTIANLDDMEASLQTMFQNALDYNDEATQEYKFAKEMQAWSAQKVRDMRNLEQRLLRG